MKKRILNLILAGAIVFSPLYASAESTDISGMTLDELQKAYVELEAKYNSLLEKSGETEIETVSDFEYEADGHTFKYLKNEVAEKDGEEFVYVFFEYTNDSGESTTPYYALSVNAYQNGVQIDPYISYDEPFEEADTAYKDIKSGTTVDIALKFLLSDDSPVSIEISPYVMWGEMKAGEFTFELNK